MNCKKLLTLLLTLCLVIGVLAPAAGAVTLAGNKGHIHSGSDTSSGSWKDLVATKGDKGYQTLRDNQDHVVDRDQLTFVNGQWMATNLEGISVPLKDAQLPQDIRVLKEASEHYTAQELVYAFIVFEDDPTAETYGSTRQVPEALTADLLAKQDQTIRVIEDAVFAGESMNIVSRFTHLTNAVVISTAYGNLQPIAAVQGVKSVFISPVYEACQADEVIYPATTSSSIMSNVASVWQDLGYTGNGMTIAVLDTGLDLDHPSFAADPKDPAWNAEWVQQMLDTYDLNAEELYAAKYNTALTADDLFYSAKVPYIFNYASGTTNVSHTDGLSDHGTHVAGIAAANNLEGSGVVGMAPDAQIIVMKVFNSETGGSNMYDMVKALEDCMTMGIDVVNLSLGSPAGFSETDIEEIDSIFRRISESDIIVDIAAGNEATSSYASSYGYYMQPTDHIDNATISSPATFANAMAIGSVDNAYVYGSYFSIADGTNVFYMQCAEYHTGYISYNLEILAGQDLEYVVVPGLGEESDFYAEDGTSLVEGKIAIVQRGSITFAEKAFNAQAAGAVGVLIWNNVSEDIFIFGMTVTDSEGNMPSIPVALISLEDGQIMEAAENKRMNVAELPGLRKDAHGGQMSSFSSWGVSPDLRLIPDLSGVGGNVFSCYDGGYYGIMSGTSMATPQVAGITALVIQYLKQEFPDATVSEMRMLADSLLMSTAVTVIDQESGVEASPRQQGAGLVDALKALTSEAFLSVDGCDRPKAELGDSEEGSYSFTFTVHNYSDSEKTYELSASLLCEDYFTTEAYPDVYFMAEQDRALDNSAVSFSVDSVVVPAGGSAEVTVTINLTEADKTWIDTYFANGNYVEGYIYLTGEEEITLSLPFLGFYGRWDSAPVFDDGFWYEPGLWLDNYTGIDNNEYYHILWTNLDGQDYLLGFNPYGDVSFVLDENGNPVDVDYDPCNNVISPNGDGAVDQLTDLYLSLMRNASVLSITYTDEAGNILHEEDLEKIDKTMYVSAYGGVVPFVYSWYYDNLYDFTDAEGNYLADGTTVYLNISGVIDYEGAEKSVMAAIPLHIDTSAPALDYTKIVESTDENGNYLTLTFTEEHPALAAVMNQSGSQVYSRYSENDMIENGDGTYTVTVDVTGLGDNFVVVLCDYGCNEAYYELSYELVDNNPEVSEDTLFAYQVHNSNILNNYGYDYMFGWCEIDKTTADVTMLQSDAYEYYALIAAEYAGGYIFAVDAGYNLMYMVPGLWNRNVICNIGVNVIDMAFDEVSQTMYLTTKDSDKQSFCLYTLDLMTGELTLLRDYYSNYEMPWAMTFVDGKLYCCKYYYNGFYEIDLENGSYDLTQVVDAEGNEFKPTTSSGGNVSPGYSQSMTYSKKDGKIYWAYYSMNTRVRELITIDPATWTCTATTFDWDQEYVGLLTVEDDAFEIPESTEISVITLSDEQLIMAPGTSYQLGVTLLPWNAPVTEDVVWTSSDPSIATVENGLVNAVGEGAVVITATYGELSDSCSINVVDITGYVNAYNYYSGDGAYGTWLNIDLKNMAAEYTYESPVDFYAADYNGHNGMIYGFDEKGQFYSFNPASGECVALGTPTTAIPADMAYDYSTGLMYAITHDYNTMTSTLYYVNMNTGALVEAAIGYDIYMTLACDMDGYLYAINVYGQLFTMEIMEGGGGGGIGGWEPLSVETMQTENVLYAVPIMQTPVEMLQYAQSMCYDHVNNVILWTNPEHSTIYWIDPWAEEPFAISLGDPTGSGLIEFTGMYVVPEEINELPYTPVEYIEGADMMLLAGKSAVPAVSVMPLNATNQSGMTYVSGDESIVRIENGVLVGVASGTTTVTATLVDGENTFQCEFTVTVKNSTDNIFGYLMSDLATYDGYYWIELPDSDPSNYYPVEYAYFNGAYLTIYAAEYVDGYIYAYGYDDMDWSANFQYLMIDAATWSVISAVDMGDEFPFVYDMAYDYTTGTMYALAGTSSSTDLYIVNMANGGLIESVITDPMFMSLAIDDEGTIYAMAASEEDFDPMTWMSTFTNAVLYTIDPTTGEYEPFMDTGVCSNMISSMAYDFDTGYIYWTGLFQGSSYVNGLYLIDPADQSCNSLGTIGSVGAQVSALMVIADDYPEVPVELQNMILTNPNLEVAVGSAVTAETFLQPSFAEVEMTWTSADESIATVDAYGVITGVSAGVTTVTVTAQGNGKTVSATCNVMVYGVEDYFLTYNRTDIGFASIGRPDPTVVNNLTEGETEAQVRAMASVNGVVYAYDAEGNLFVTSANNEYKRTYIGNCGIEVEEPYEDVSAGYYTYYYTYTPDFVVRDMAWDAANGRMLALGCYGVNEEYYYTTGTYTSPTYNQYMELSSGCRLYEVDLTTGALTELCVIGGVDGPESGVQMMTVTDEGVIYIYTSFMDYVMILDDETGAVEYLSTFQNLGMYGSSEGDPMAMVYDPITDNIFLLFTQNGNLYYLYKFNPGTTALNRVGEVGTEMDGFAGLLINEVHICEHEETERVDATCTEDGYVTSICACGHTITETLTASGHNYESVVTEPSCTEGGCTTHTCSNCGDTYVTDETAALGHNYESVVTEPSCTEGGCTTHTCSNCGDTYVTDETAALGHDAQWVVIREATETEPGLEQLICQTCGEVLDERNIYWNDSPNSGDMSYLFMMSAIVSAAGVLVLMFKRKRI